MSLFQFIIIMALQLCRLSIRVRDGRDPIIDQLSMSLGTIQFMDIFRLAADTDMRFLSQLHSS